MDKKDRAILSYLQGDASLSVGDLAEKVGVSKSACWRRIQKLEERGVIRGRVTPTGPNGPGPDTHSIRVSSHQPAQ